MKSNSTVPYISLVRISPSCSHCSSSYNIDCVELWYRNLQTGSEYPGELRPATLIQIICCFAILGTPDTEVTEVFGIFTESTMLNNSQSIAQENGCQLLNSPETHPAQYISNHPRIERLSKWYRVDVLYPKTQLAYSRLTWGIQPSFSLLRNEVQAHLRSTLLLSLKVSYLTLHGYSIQRPVLTSRPPSLSYHPMPGTPLNRAYPLCITLEQFISLHSKHIFFLPECFESVATSAQWVSFYRHKTFKCRGGSSRSASADIWIYAWSVCEGHHINAITAMLHVNLSFGGRCLPYAYCRCTALGDK